MAKFIWSKTEIERITNYNTISIHQPHLFPWLPYIYKLHLSRTFVSLDDVHFKKNGDENRFRINGPNGWFWSTCPLTFKGKGTLLSNAYIAEKDWFTRFMKTVQTVYGKTKNRDSLYRAVGPKSMDAMVELETPFAYIANSSIMSMAKEMSMPIPASFIQSSCDRSEYTGSERILQMCRALGAEIYICGAYGANYLDLDKFRKYKIDVVNLRFDFDGYKSRWPMTADKANMGFSALDFMAENDNPIEYCIDHAQLVKIN